MGLLIYLHRRQTHAQNQKFFRAIKGKISPFLKPISNQEKKRKEKVQSTEKTNLSAPRVGIGVAESGEEDLDSDLPGLWWGDLHVFEHQRLVGFPCHSSFLFIPTNKKNREIKRN